MAPPGIFVHPGHNDARNPLRLQTHSLPITQVCISQGTWFSCALFCRCYTGIILCMRLDIEPLSAGFDVIIGHRITL